MFKDYLDFFSFLVNIRDVDMALSFHTVAGQAIDPGTHTREYVRSRYKFDRNFDILMDF